MVNGFYCRFNDFFVFLRPTSIGTPDLICGCFLSSNKNKNVSMSEKKPKKTREEYLVTYLTSYPHGGSIEL